MISQGFLALDYSRFVGDSPKVETGPIRVLYITDLQFASFADIIIPSYETEYLNDIAQ